MTDKERGPFVIGDGLREYRAPGEATKPNSLVHRIQPADDGVT